MKNYQRWGIGLGITAVIAGALGASHRTEIHNSFDDNIMFCWLTTPRDDFKYTRTEEITKTTYLLGMPIRSEVVETKKQEHHCFKPLGGGRYELLAPLL